MGGGGFIGALPSGASSWCTGDDVIGNLNNVFLDPASSNGEYQAARAAAPLFGQVQNVPGNWQNLLAAYTDAFDRAGEPICSGWSTYLRNLGELGVNIVTTSSTSTSSDVLVFGTTTAAIPVWMQTGLMVYDASTPGAITGGQTVTGINTPSAGQIRISANVNAAVNSGDTIVFYATAYGGNAVTRSPTNTSSPVLTFGAGNIPSWMAKGLNVYDASTPGAITGGQSVLDFDNKTVTLTTGVNAMVRSGDTIVFSVPPGQGQLNIYNIAQARYQCLVANVGMKTSKHDPHGKKHGHRVKRSGIIVTTLPTDATSQVLTFGAGNIPSWMEVGMNVFDASTPGAVTAGQTVTGINTPGAGQISISANVNATVNSGDTIVFSEPPVVGSITIDSPYIAPSVVLQIRRGMRERVRRYLQSKS